MAFLVDGVAIRRPKVGRLVALPLNWYRVVALALNTLAWVAIIASIRHGVAH